MTITTAMSARSLQFYVVARRWASDIEFFKVETAFLHRILNNYFGALSDASHRALLLKSGNHLIQLEENKHHAELLVSQQLTQIELMTEDLIPENIEELSITQMKLEHIMNNLMQEYRDVKKELFMLIETVMQYHKTLPG